MTAKDDFDTLFGDKLNELADTGTTTERMLARVCLDLMTRVASLEEAVQMIVEGICAKPR